MTALVLALRPVLLWLGDRSWIRILRVLSWIPALREPATEAAEVLEAGPPGTTLLRGMVADSTEEEIRDLLWGLRSFREWGP